MQVISFVNMKGGVAKTTLAVNIGYCLVRRHNSRVLIIDLDPQFNATQTLISAREYAQKIQTGQHTILQVFEDLSRPIASTVSGSGTNQPTRIEDIAPWVVHGELHLLPGSLELYRLEMSGGQGRENRLRRFMEVLRGRNAYDYVIIDTPPTPSAWMSSALIASEHYVVPVKPEPLSTTGIDLLRTVVSTVTANYALNLSCAGVVLTLAEEQTLVYKQALEFLNNNPFWNGKTFRHVFPKRTVVARMQGQQKLILDADDATLSYAVSGITTELLEALNP
jgi:chromosome partitioning protein